MCGFEACIADSKNALEMQITFEGDRTVKGFYQFLKKHAAIPFALHRTAKSKASNKAAEDVKDEL